MTWYDSSPFFLEFKYSNFLCCQFNYIYSWLYNENTLSKISGVMLVCLSQTIIVHQTWLLWNRNTLAWCIHVCVFDTSLLKHKIWKQILKFLMIVYNSCIGCYSEHGLSSQFFKTTLFQGLVLFWILSFVLNNYVVLLVGTSVLDGQTAYKATWCHKTEHLLPWKCASVSFYRWHSKV